MSTPAPQSDTVGSTWTVLGRPLPAKVRIALSLDLIVAGICFCVLAVITFTGAVSRYFLSTPFVWLEEAQLALFLALVFLGMGAAARSGGHVAIDVVTELLPEKIRRGVLIATTAIVVLVAAFYGWESLQQLLGMAQLGRETPLLRIPSALIYTVAPIGFALLILNSVLALLFNTEADDDQQEDHRV